MKLNENLLKAMQNYIVASGVRSQRVTGFEEYTYTSGYCETCYFEETRVRIDFLDNKGRADEYDYYGSFAEFIRDLDKHSD